MIYGRNIKHFYIYIVVKVIPAQCPEWELKGAKKTRHERPKFIYRKTETT